MEKEIRLQAALQMKGTGYEIVLLRDQSKAAFFKAWNQREPLSRFEIQAQMRRRLFNIGIWLKGILIVDLDNKDLEWGKAHGIESPMIARTARGFHLYFQHCLDPPKSGKFEGGDIKMTGYIVAPPSVVKGWRYEWIGKVLAPDQLPPAPDLLKQEELLPKPRIQRVLEIPETAKIEGMRKWIGKVHAVEGEGGDSNTFRVAMKICAIVRDFHLALAELELWNETNAHPQWNVDQMKHKIASAMKYIV